MRADSFDAIVVGAGPAGLAAATELAARGAATLLVDDQPAPGGQIYRAAERSGPAEVALFGPSTLDGARLIASFRRQPVDYRPGTSVVHATPDGVVDLLDESGMSRAHGRALVLATGAQERPLPVPGWTLPGVMTAGAGQLLAKQSRAVPAGRTVLAGNGPLIWLLAWQYARLGARLAALVIVRPRGAARRSAGFLPGFLGSAYVRDALKYLASARRTTRIVQARRILGIEGTDRATGLLLEGRGGRRLGIEADTVLLHDGVVPNVHLAGALGCTLAWNERQQCWAPGVDVWQRTSLAGVHVAGDGAGIGGARAAACSGRLAALDTLFRLGRLSGRDRDAAAAPVLAERRRHLAGRGFLDAYFAPLDTMGDADPGTTLCRCEGVTVGQAAAVLRDGPRVLDHVKALTRCGMGPCQGRMCGPSIAALMRRRFGVHPEAAGPPSHRFPTVPVSTEALAGMEPAEGGRAADVRE